MLPKCCSVLRCGAVQCSELQYVAVCCSMLQCVVVCCSILLQYVVVCCSVLHTDGLDSLTLHFDVVKRIYVAVCCRNIALHCSELQCVAVRCSVLQCVAA